MADFLVRLRFLPAGIALHARSWAEMARQALSTFTSFSKTGSRDGHKREQLSLGAIMRANVRTDNMTRGWKISVVVRQKTGGRAVERERFLVAIPDKAGALRAVQARLPDAELKIDSEASAECLEGHLMRPGEVFALHPRDRVYFANCERRL